MTKKFVSMFPKFSSVSLLYKMSEDGIGTKTFHILCDNKGPTVMLVKANKYYIFGAFCPLSFMAENLYTESDDAFIFSL